VTGTEKSPGGRPLTPPRGAAIAGVIFSLPMIVALGIARSAVPADLTRPDVWLTEPDRRAAVRLALYLVPFAGIAFLWVMGVLRDRLGELEDQFFATVFLGSGLLFVACMFGAAAMSGALIEVAAVGNLRSPDIATLDLGRRATDAFLNVFAMKMAGVFMISTCTIGLRSAIFPRWIAFAGYVCALVLLLAIANWKWIALGFPLWMLLVSMQILLAEFRSRLAGTAGAGNYSAER
jgi:hypothetical protein